MKRWSLGFAVLLGCGVGGLGCGGAAPAVTVPAPVVKVEAAAPQPPPAPEGLAPPEPTLRLPRNFLPTGYAARLDVDPASSGFEGAIQITGNVGERSLAIWLNARGLTVHKAVAQRAGQPDVALTATPRGEDFLELRAAEPLDAGAWTLAIDYAGSFDTLNTTGAFKQTIAGASYVYTQFEAVYARRAFPCFDEPDNKVPWQLTLDVPAQLAAVANAPQTAESPLPGGKKRVEFAPTKPLPSYLVAFGVGPFEFVDAGKTQRGTPVRVVALAHRAADAAFAAKTSAKLIDLLEDYFGSPYPYPKIDMLTIPITVGFGAMENAGLITYTETSILQDAKASRQRHLGWISVASHELAHQWFGDLVTMAYWDDIWLNEGFASWMARKIVARFEPAWRDDQSELNTRDVALDSDSLVSARQIRQPIKRQDDIFTAFDRITYDKGASILNMFESYLGADTFQRGVRDYVAARAWGNATSTDFVAAISKAAGKDVGPAFATFLEQPGTPEITATAVCEAGKASVALAQQRYVPPGAPTPPATRPWIVPVCVAFDKGGGQRGEACTLLDQPTGSLELPTKACPRWVMPNVNGRGYYRNVYTPAQVGALRDEGWAQLSWIERRAVFRDVRDAVGNGKLPLQLALSLVPKLLAGNDRFTVGPAIQLATGLGRTVPEDLLPKYEAWLRQTFGPGAAKAGLVPRDSDTLDIEITRGALTGAVAWSGRDPRLVAEAAKLAEHWRDLPQSVRGEVLRLAVDARPEVFERTLQEVRTETDRGRRQEMLRALASVRDPRRYTTALGLMLDKTLDPRETLTMLFGGGGGGRGGGGVTGAEGEAHLAVAQAFFREHQAEIMGTMPQDGTAGPFARLSGLFTATCRADQRDAVADYVQNTFTKLPGGKRIIAQNLEQMDQCIARRQQLEPEIRAWLTGTKARPPAKP
jgi:cytosol alanyl aminopeptidase